MELRNINTFLKVAGTQNFSKAAEQLGYSQSAVTIQIQQLEKELQIQLFERIGKRVYLTEKGQEFVSYANDIMQVTDNAKYFARQNNVLEGTLRIGGVESICTALLPDLLLNFYQLCPNIQVTIKSGATEELMEMAKNNEIDFVYTLDKKIIGKEWNRAVITEEEIVFVTLEDKANGYYDGIPIQQLMQKPFILTERGAAYQYELERLLSEKDLEINPILEIGNTETIINLVKRGMGVSFLPKFTVQKELEKRVLSEIKTNLPSVKMYSQLFYHKNKWITKQMRKFIELVENFHA